MDTVVGSGSLLAQKSAREGFGFIAFHNFKKSQRVLCFSIREWSDGNCSLVTLDFFQVSAQQKNRKLIYKFLRNKP